MNFKESKAIYLQMADRICDKILLGQYQEKERILSAREYTVIIEVDANTAVRSFEYLQSQNIIYSKRGIGYFVSADAKDLILSLRRETFLKDELEHVLRQLYTLGVSDKELLVMYRNFIMKQK